MIKQLLGAAALVALTLGSAHAALIVQSGNIAQIDNNVINGGACGGLGGPAFAIEGCFNSQTNPIVNFTSDEQLVYGAGGQARVEANANEYSRLMISVDGINISTLILNISAEADGYVRFTDGVTLSSLFSLSDNGNNFFTITGGSFDYISYITYSDSAGTTEADIVADTRQIRIGLDTPSQVPEPATLGLFTMGLLGLGVAIYRRRRHR